MGSVWVVAESAVQARPGVVAILQLNSGTESLVGSVWVAAELVVTSTPLSKSATLRFVDLFASPVSAVLAPSLSLEIQY